MCKICEFFICPPACPSYDGESAEYGKPLGRCDGCGDYVYEGDLYYVEKRKIFCADCAQAIE